MREASLTIQERQLITLMRWWVTLFTIAAILFAFAPQKVVDLLNYIGALIHWGGPPVATTSEHFWSPLGVSLLVVLILTSYLIQKDLLHHIKYTRLIIIAKLVSAICYLISFFSFDKSFAYLVAFLVDGAIAVLTWAYYRRAALSRYVI